MNENIQESKHRLKRSTLIRVGSQPHSTYTKVSKLSSFTSLVTYLCLIFRKWSKGQLRLQSLMDFLQQELQLAVDPAIRNRQLDREVADTFPQILGGDGSLKHPEKRPRAARLLFRTFFFVVRRCWPFCPKKEFDTLIHLWMIDDQLFHVEMQK